MKIRALHPEFFADPDVARLSPMARILFAGLWCHSDDYGRNRWLPKRIEGDIFPHDDVDIAALLAEVVEAGFVTRYDADGGTFYEIASWEKYQKPKYRATPLAPDPARDENPVSADPGQVGDKSGTSPGQGGENFGLQEEGEGEASNPSDSDRRSLFDAFCEFWTGKPYDKDSLTELERGRLNKAVKQARSSGIDADEVRRRGKQYLRQWADLERTPQALLANWARFAPEAEAVVCDTCHNKGRVGFTDAGAATLMDDAAAVDYGLCPDCHPEVPK